MVRRRNGFTLIELLTVIAIIAILAAITFAVAPRMLERARVRSAVSTMKQLDTVLSSYFADNVTGYPPHYGFLTSSGQPYSKPWMAAIGQYGNVEIYDPFSTEFGYDGNRDNDIDLMEFQPVNINEGDEGLPVTFPSEIYRGNNLPDQLALIENQEQRPLYYIPVNLAQFKRARDFWLATGDVQATTWNSSDTRLQGISFPPPRYDGYVLISVGPAASTFGVVPTTVPQGLTIPSGDNPGALSYLYHVQCLRAFFLATRDLNNDDYLDLDFETRRQGIGVGAGAAGQYQYTFGGNTFTVSNQLPEFAPDGYGPLIHLGPGITKTGKELL